MPLKDAAAKPARMATMSNTTSRTKTLTKQPPRRGSTMSHTAWPAVKRIWFSVTRRATARPAAGSEPRERQAPKPKRASAPRRESRRATEPPRRVSGSVTVGSTRGLPLQPVLGLGEVREGVDRPLEQLACAGVVAAVVIQERAGVVGQRLRRHLAVHALLGRLSRQSGEVRNVLEEGGRNRLDDVEHVSPLHP